MGTESVARQTTRVQRADPNRAAFDRGARRPSTERTRTTRLQRALGNRGMARLLRSGVIQAKLAVGPADDGYEREADRMADEAMRMPEPQALASQRTPLQVQRMCLACEDETGLRRNPDPTKETTEEDEGLLQAKQEGDCSALLVARSSGVAGQAHGGAKDEATAPPALEAALHASRGGGREMPPALRQFYESRFASDLSSVRIHTDSTAAYASRQLRAQAFTVGRDVFFAGGHYQPDSWRGRRLLAHELTHVQQQTGGKPLIQTQPDDLAGIGTGIQPLEIDDWKAELKKQGYTEFHSNRDGFKGWAKDAFPDRRKRPDLIAVDHTRQRVLVGDVTAGPWSETDVKPSDRRPLPNELGEDDPYRAPKRRHKPQKQAHGSKTKADGRQAARNLPAAMQGYEIAAEERYWNAKAKTSGRFVVKKKGPSAAPAPKGGVSKGAGGSGGGSGGAGRGGKTLRGRIGQAAKTAGGGLKSLGRGALKVLPVLAVLGPLFEVRDALAAFDAAKVKVDEFKRILDAAWAEYEKMVKGLGGGAPSGATAPVRQPVQQPLPEPPSPEPASRMESVRVYDIFRQRLRKRSMEVATDRLKASYTPVIFTSLTDIDAYTTVVPSDQYDCPAVLKSGIRGFRQLYNFEGYSARGDYRRLKDLLAAQIAAVRLLCAVKALDDARSQEPAVKPDGDQITVYLDWVVGNLSDSISATCQNSQGAGNWDCGSDGDFARLREATDEEERPDYQIQVELIRRAGGQESRWMFTLGIDTPDPANPEPHITSEGSLPEDACDPDRYPRDSVLAYVLQHYAAGCQ
jgi:Domain of unknown function (DUF4157)